MPAITPNSSSSVPTRSRVESFLEKHDPVRARLVFALDATASRQPTWDTAAKLQGEMFGAAATVGNLSCQLVYYRGYNGECRTSPWFDSAQSLGSAMNKIICMAGHTQIEKVLRHAAREHAKASIAALIFIGDACEEQESDLYAAARELPVPTFFFQEGNSDLVAGIFGKIAEITKGAVVQFDTSSATKLADLLKAVAVFATGGITALEAQKSAAAQLLLTHLKKK
jgi:hypothetical protein